MARGVPSDTTFYPFWGSFEMRDNIFCFLEGDTCSSREKNSSWVWPDSRRQERKFKAEKDILRRLRQTIKMHCFQWKKPFYFSRSSILFLFCSKASLLLSMRLTNEHNARLLTQYKLWHNYSSAFPLQWDTPVTILGQTSSLHPPPIY